MVIQGHTVNSKPNCFDMPIVWTPKRKPTRAARGLRRLSLGEPTPALLESEGGWLTAGVAPTSPRTSKLA
jgi:hypothetical protein